MLSRKFVKWIFIALFAATLLVKFDDVFSQSAGKTSLPEGVSARPVKKTSPVTLISVSGEKSKPTLNRPGIQLPAEIKNHPEQNKFHANGDQSTLELIHLRTANTRTYLRKDGTFSKEFSPAPLHYKDNQDRWISISENCAFNNEVPGEYGIVRSDMPVFVNILTGHGYVGMEPGSGAEFSEPSLTITDGNGNVKAVLNPNTLVKGEINGNDIVFNNYWPSVSRVLHINAGMMKTNYVLDGIPKNIPTDGQLIITEKVKLPYGWTIQPAEKGSSRNNNWFGALNIIHANGKVKGTFAPLVYFGNDEEQAFDGGYKIENKNGMWEVSLVVPASWLYDIKRIYPVTLDPAVTNIYNTGNAGSSHNQYCTHQVNILLPQNSYVTNAAFETNYTAISPAKKRNGRIALSGANGISQEYYCNDNAVGTCNVSALSCDAINGFYSDGNVPVTLNVMRTNAGGSGSCSSTHLYVNNNSWKTTIDYSVCPQLTTPAVIAGPASATCNQELTFTSTGGSGSWQWQYSVNGNAFADVTGATSSNMNISFNETGSYQIRLVSRAEFCNTSYSNIIAVNVSAPLSGVSTEAPVVINQLPYSNTHDNYCYPAGFTASGSQGTAAVFFRFTTSPCASTVSLNTCSPVAGFDTYLFLLDQAGNVIASNDDNNGCAYTVNGNYSLSAINDFIVTPSTTYYAVVQSGASAVPSTGRFGINITESTGTSSEQPVANAGTDRSVCNLLSLQLQADAPIQGYTGEWSLVSGSGTFADPYAATTIVSGLSTTSPNIFRWNVSGTCGSASDTVVIKVFTAPPPNQPTVIGPYSGCSGDTITFTTNLNAETLVWTARPEGIIHSGQGTQEAQIIFGNTTFTGFNGCVQGSNACGSNVTKCHAIRANTSTPYFASGPENVCDSSTVIYSVNGVEGGKQYKWTANEGILFNGNPSPYITGDTTVSVYFPPGYINTKIGVASSVGCAFSQPRERTVNAMPLIPGVINGDVSNLCNTTKTYFIKHRAELLNEWSVPVGAAILYTSADTDTIRVSFPSTATGTISVRSRNNCGVYGPFRKLNVTTQPPLPGVISGPVTVCAGSSDNQYSIIPVVGASTYLWSVPTGSQITSGAGTENISVKFGTITNKVTVQSSSGCGLSALRTLALSAASCRTEGEETTDANVVADEFNLQAYPDRETHMLTVTFNADADGEYSYSVLSTGGTELLSGVISAVKGNNMQQIDMSSLPDATYRLEIKNQSTSRHLNIRFF